MKTPYDDLAIMPEVIAEVVLAEKYTGIELGIQLRDHYIAEETEAKRLAMTQAERQEFIALCDHRCRYCYSVKADWFMKIAKSKTNRGRDTLYSFIRHWLCAYLNNREIFVRGSSVVIT